MSEPTLAELRWTVDYDTLTFADGKKIKFPEWVPLELIERLGELPRDFYNLGNATADEVAKAQMARRKGEADRLRAETAEATLRDIRENTDNESILPVLMADLETAINMIFRYAGMLGIQAGGELYDAINALANKYKMHYTPPKDYSYEGMVAPMLSQAGGLAYEERKEIETESRQFQAGIDFDAEGSATIVFTEIDPPEAEFLDDEPEPDEQYDQNTRDWVND